ncbi:SDR family oxidoreductase [Niabella yanshanensis]|uniref:SDR family oxidoreductase n=1 Tax=Niabella yanshanensis TaxID=577386 RepID=A0ABZ0W981_9BACT|nr:SDR family oxidoreductase [Niabella yanshanensis]WQD39089.1 SDR family oxidoreductase [Niabella yanshanensis]
MTSLSTANISDKSFLITGGAGFIGSHLVEYLINAGAEKVRVLDNLATGSAANLKDFQHNSAFEFIEGDIRDMDICKASCEGIDFVSHQAALGSVPRSVNDPVTTNAVNISGFLNVLTAAKDSGVIRMVYAASSSTYGDHPNLPKLEDTIGAPLSPYAVTKYVNELYADVFSRLYNFHTVGLRYFNVFGPRQNPSGPYAAVIPLFMQSAVEDLQPTINGDGETSRDFTYIDNVVQANVKSFFSESVQQHEVVNIAYGQKTTLNALWNSIALLAGTNQVPLYGPERKGDVKHSLASIAKAAALINYEPTVSVEAGLERTFDWFKKNTPAVS